MLKIHAGCALRLFDYRPCIRLICDDNFVNLLIRELSLGAPNLHCV